MRDDRNKWVRVTFHPDDASTATWEFCITDLTLLTSCLTDILDGADQSDDQSGY